MPTATERPGAAPIEWRRAGDDMRFHVRPVRPHDAAALDGFFRALSPMSRIRRFHAGVRALPREVLERFTHPDRCDEVALLAVTVQAGREICIGEARYSIVDGDLSAGREFALTVADEWQRRGVGRRLLQRLTRHAARSGIARLFGDVLRDNQPMIALAGALGFAQRRHPDDARLLRVVRTLDAAPMAALALDHGAAVAVATHGQPG